VDFDEDARWLALHRCAVTVAVNFGGGGQDLGPGIGELLLATDDGIELKDGGVHLPAKSAAILRRL
jgi:maltooligosyltrehalose trehalohydrolase